MFWGLIMEPNKRYTQVVENPFHISQAALDISTGDGEACQVMVLVDGKNFLVCTLQKNKIIQVPLDLYFKTGDSISFLTNGKCNVHLTGYLDPEYEEDLEEEEDDEEDEEEAPELVPAKNKRKLENSNDSASKKPKQDKKAKKAPAEDSDDSDDDDQLQKLLDGEDVDSDENDDSFKINTSTEADSDEDSDEDEDDEDEEEAEAEESDSDEEEDSQADTTLDTSKEEKDIDMSKLSKTQRRRLKKKLQQQQKQQPQVNGNGIEKKEKKQDAQPKPDKNKQGGKKENEQPAVDKKEKKTISGGVAIEDLKVGNGPIAKPGKTVQVYYEGRLKTNNKMFDTCTKGPGFKFRLGSKEVISGWDVGVSGMKVGGKRRIVCPPAMAYGAKGSPPVIPPNSTLVFEVELKNVK